MEKVESDSGEMFTVWMCNRGARGVCASQFKDACDNLTIVLRLREAEGYDCNPKKKKYRIYCTLERKVEPHTAKIIYQTLQILQKGLLHIIKSTQISV